MSNANIRCRSLTRRKKEDGGTHTYHTRHADKMIVILTIENKMR